MKSPVTSSWRKTQTGKIIYDRKPHTISVRDITRMMRKCGDFYIPPDKHETFIIEFFAASAIVFGRVISFYVMLGLTDMLRKEFVKFLEEVFMKLKELAASMIWAIVDWLIEKFGPKKKS